MANLVDTNILLYTFDERDTVKQHRAEEILRNGLFDGSVVLTHQCVVEFVAAVSRPREELGRAPLLSIAEARLEAEELLTQYPVHELPPLYATTQTQKRPTAGQHRRSYSARARS